MFKKINALFRAVYGEPGRWDIFVQKNGEVIMKPSSTNSCGSKG